MHDKVFSCTIDGLTPKIIEVETDIQNGLPNFSIVGLGDASIQEAKERVRSALKNSRAQFPPLRKTVNLAPANIRKHGPAFDLPIAVSVLAASNQIPKHELRESLFIGELALDGKLRKVRGVLPIAAHAFENGFRTIYLPRANADEASFVSGLKIMPVADLKELIAHFYKGNVVNPHQRTNTQSEDEEEEIYDFKFISGREREKRAAVIAAAGRHHVLMCGPPGSGKTLLSRTFRTILPPLSGEEALSITSIYSIAGLLPAAIPLITKRPFREIHPSATENAILGGCGGGGGGPGGGNIRPGEITLGHKGAVFFDELSEFPLKVLESLRKPLEDGTITIQRTTNKLTFPADFIFIGAINPCPCGFYGDPRKPCVCSMGQITRHKKKLSGPFLDRIDMFLPIRRMRFEKFANPEKTETSAEIGKLVRKAAEIQTARQGKSNGKLASREVRKFCGVNSECKNLLKEAAYKFSISTRGLLSILKIARTIADLAETEKITAEYVAEALQYRTPTLQQ